MFQIARNQPKLFHIGLKVCMRVRSNTYMMWCIRGAYVVHNMEVTAIDRG